ncbi:hypothetical protein VB734_08120 [Synechococcus sp. BA-124 BA4]|uniref:hypothetical protein n=1 Tax=unclassified Synechococcus TaxID=2626047 RepID=UPI0018CECE40|nr:MULTISPECIES: hypothetical protein [unclassified Synechococcus]MEA5400001.1 hypothetical protein [Synechococcus sp. BA-124 BA4]QPN56430.1 hypothetical protein I1E95_15365 [Synechococcus sp. CBW1107]
MVAVPSPQPFFRRRSLELIQGSFSARRVVRQAPWLAGLHRASDGLLVALGLSMVGLTALTLHWQGQWTRSFELLESTQVLEHRLQESTAVLEQHHLAMARRPGLLVPTSLQRLIHLPSPSAGAPQGLSNPTASQPQSRPFSLQALDPRTLGGELSRISLDPRIVRAGY